MLGKNSNMGRKATKKRNSNVEASSEAKSCTRNCHRNSSSAKNCK